MGQERANEAKKATNARRKKNENWIQNSTAVSSGNTKGDRHIS